MTVMGADVALTWLHTWLMTSACPVNKMTVMDADVACHVAADVSLTQPVTRSTGQPGQTRPGQRLTGSTRPGQRVNRVIGQPGLVNGQPDPVNRVNRANGQPGQTVQPDPVITAQQPCHALPRASIRADSSGGA